MAITIPFSGQNYTFPSQSERNWAAAVNAFMQGLAANALPKSGGNFTLSADLNLGNTASVYVKALASNTTGIAAAGFMRLAKTDVIAWRNNAGNADLSLDIDGSDRLRFAGDVIAKLSEITGLSSTVAANLAAALLLKQDKTQQLQNLSDHIAALPNGFLHMNGVGLFASRTLAAGSPKIAITNSSGAAGNPTIDASEADFSLQNIGGSLTDAQLYGKLLGRPTIDDWMDINEETAPATPASGRVRVYAKSDKKIYTKGSDGLEKAIGSGSGSGEINLILSPNESTNWTGTGTVATDSTPSNFPLQGALESAIKFTSGTAGQYREYAFSVPSALARKLKIEFWYKHAGSATDWKVELYKAGVKQTLKTDVSGNSYIPAGTGRWTTDFDFEAASYSLRIVRVASVAMDIYFQGAIVGPGITAQGAAVGEWQTYTPQGAWTTNVTYAGKAKRDGSDLLINLSVALSGAPTGTFVLTTAQLLNGLGLTLNTAALPNYGAVAGAGLSYTWHCGDWTAVDSGNNNYIGAVMYDSVSSIFRFLTSSSPSLSVSPTNPFTFGSADNLSAEIRIPIAEWAGNGTVNLGAGAQVEYAYNTGNITVANGTDTSSFGSGSNGTPILSYNSATVNAYNEFRVQFATPIQADDILSLEIYNGVGWYAAESTFPFIVLNTSYYGCTVAPLTATTASVLFGNQGARPTSAATYAASGQAWSVWSGLNYRWRVRKAKASSPVGFGMATATDSGLLKSYDEGVFVANFSTGMRTGTNNFTVTYTRVGRVVTLSFPDMRVTANGTNIAWTAVAGTLPISLRPSTSRIISGIVMNNNTGESGYFVINADGSMSMYRHQDVTWTSGTANCGSYFANITFNI